MKLLAIESSATTASVAILTDNILTAEYTTNYKKTHSQTLLPMIDQICRMTDTDPKTFDGVAVSVGPGSFTGLRIGIATAKGIAMVSDIKIAAVPTLEAMAYNAQCSGKTICCIMDARRKHLYSAIYRFDSDGNVEIIRGQNLISYDDLCCEINKSYDDVLFIGDGIECAGDYLKENLKCTYHFAPAQINSQRAASVAQAGMKIFECGNAQDADSVVPDYLRPSQAERELEEKHVQYKIYADK